MQSLDKSRKTSWGFPSRPRPCCQCAGREKVCSGKPCRGGGAPPAPSSPAGWVAWGQLKVGLFREEKLNLVGHSRNHPVVPLPRHLLQPLLAAWVLTDACPHAWHQPFPVCRLPLAPCASSSLSLDSPSGPRVQEENKGLPASRFSAPSWPSRRFCGIATFVAVSHKLASVAAYTVWGPGGRAALCLVCSPSSRAIPTPPCPAPGRPARPISTSSATSCGGSIGSPELHKPRAPSALLSLPLSVLSATSVFRGLAFSH